MQTLAYHAQQSDATARDGYWHAAINEARTFFEALVIKIALEEERPPEESIADFRKRREAHCGFPSCCRYLEEIGFFRHHERLMVQHTYTLPWTGPVAYEKVSASNPGAAWSVSWSARPGNI